MIWLFVGLVAVSVSLLVLGVAQLVTDPEARLVRRRLQTVPTGAGRAETARERRRRRAQRESMESFLETFGERVGGEKGRRKSVKDMLIHAGYRRPNAGVVYIGIRVVLLGAGLAGGTLLAAFFGATAGHRLLLIVAGGLLGWMLPFLVVRSRVRRRQDEIQRTLPDALDLMVVCVEAGLGLNQALVRVGEEMERVSPAVSQEFILVSLEMRAGAPREEALRNLGERTGLADVRAFVAMLIQTDRFGTSIADALRIHADELRTKRRQRAEEKAAKLTVKLLIPIILFIFPSMFIVMLGPAVFHVTEAFGGLGAP
jgi:tight adherence protein C